MKNVRLGKKKLYRAVALLLSALLLVSETPYPISAAEIKTLANPVIEDDPEMMRSNKKVTWDCIYFGSYPQAEVLSTKSRRNYAGLSDFFRTEDFIESDSLYQALEAASGWDDNNEIILDGWKYRRMKREDATWSENNDNREMDSRNVYYWEDNTSWHYFRYEPLKWRVLGLEGNEAFLVSDLVLDVRQYHTRMYYWGDEDHDKIHWNNSTLRSWLNGYGAKSNEQSLDCQKDNFIKAAFTEDERRAITVSDVRSDDSGSDTEDQVYLLSLEEVEETEAYGFGGSYIEAVGCESSTYAKAMGVIYHTGGSYDGKMNFAGCSYWWLRSSLNVLSTACCIKSDGGTDPYQMMSSDRIGIRPAIRLNLSNDGVYTYAGTVCSDQTKKEEKDGAEAPVGLSNPRSVEDLNLRAKRNVTWDCVYFGNYPQSEVISRAMSSDYEGVNGSDLYISDRVYEALEHASDWDQNNDIVVEGEKYRRINKEDASNVWRFDYNWDEDDRWHYFKYEPLKWRVLKVEGNRALLFSDRIIDCQAYSSNDNGYWHISEVRSWLNGYGSCKNYMETDYYGSRNFIDCAFTVSEQQAIPEVPKCYYWQNRNGTTGDYYIHKAATTVDKISLLTIWEIARTEEAEAYGFSSDMTLADEGRDCDRSLYATAMGASESQGWYLYQRNYEYLYTVRSGAYDANGFSPLSGSEGAGIRPAIYLDLSSTDCYTYAGTVSSDKTTSGTILTGVCGDHVTWNFTEETGELEISGSGPMYDYENISEIPWSQMRRDRKIKKVIIEDGVTKIGKQTFRSMANVYTYWEDSLEEAVIPDSVEEIGDYAFYNCNVLKAADIPGSTEKIGMGAFYYCEKLGTLSLGEGIKEIGTAAFAHSGVTNVSIPDSVTGLGKEEAERSLILSIERGGVFYGCDQLRSINLSSGLTEIGEYMFMDCLTLEEASFPSGIALIGNYAFSGCKALHSIDLPDTVREIGDYAFFRNAVTEIKIPDSVVSLGAEVFGETGLTKVVIPDTVTNLGEAAFAGCKDLSLVTLGNGLTELPLLLFSGCESLTELIIPDSVTVIVSDAQKDGTSMSPFSGCVALMRVTLSKNLKAISEYTFSDCKSLTEIIIPEKVRTIGYRAFSGCTALKKVEFKGNAPVFASFGGSTSNNQAFLDVETEVYYPADNVTWVPDIRQHYGGILTWIPSGETSAEKQEQDFTVTPERLSLALGEQAEITVTGAHGAVSYESGSEDIAMVNGRGTVFALLAGETEIIVTAAGDEDYYPAQKKIKVTVEKAEDPGTEKPENPNPGADDRILPSDPTHHCTMQNDGSDKTDFSYIYFGSYPQSESVGDALTESVIGAVYDTNGDAWVSGTKYRRISKKDTTTTAYFGDSKYRYFKWEPIKWRVLQNDGDTLFIMADTGLDCKRYNDEYDSDGVKWETSSLRNWLKDDFYQTAFDSVHQKAICEADPYHDEGEGDYARDKVSLLSIEEAMNPEYGFCQNINTESVSRMVQVSDYANARGADRSTDTACKGNGWWWIWTRANDVAFAYNDGKIYQSAAFYNDHTVSVVPVLYLDISSDLWSNAENGGGTGDQDPGNEDPGNEDPGNEDPEVPEDLIELKARAVAELNDYKTFSDYRKEQREELKIIISAGEEAIDTAADEESIANALSAAKAAMDQVKTDAQLTKEENLNSGNQEEKPGGSQTDTENNQGVQGGNGSVSVPEVTDPKAVSIQGKIKAKKRGFLVKWNRRSSASGYQIQYSTSRKFTKKTSRMKTFTGASKTKATVKGLKAKKKYYVRVRSIQITDGIPYYSNWSKAKTVRTKK